MKKLTKYLKTPLIEVRCDLEAGGIFVFLCNISAFMLYIIERKKRSKNNFSRRSEMKKRKLGIIGFILAAVMLIAAAVPVAALDGADTTPGGVYRANADEPIVAATTSIQCILTGCNNAGSIVFEETINTSWSPDHCRMTRVYRYCTRLLCGGWGLGEEKNKVPHTAWSVGWAGRTCRDCGRVEYF
jgi:hypothetical protein